MDTEMIDRLFLELSQVTGAKTKRELELEAEIARLRSPSSGRTIPVDDVLAIIERVQTSPEVRRASVTLGPGMGTAYALRAITTALREHVAHADAAAITQADDKETQQHLASNLVGPAEVEAAWDTNPGTQAPAAVPFWKPRDMDMARKIVEDPTIIHGPHGQVARVVGREAEAAERHHRTLTADSAPYLLRAVLKWIDAGGINSNPGGK